MDKNLTRLRAQIDQVDQQILDLLSRRLQMSEKVAEAKPSGASIFRPDREAQLLARLCAAADPQQGQILSRDRHECPMQASCSIDNAS